MAGAGKWWESVRIPARTTLNRADIDWDGAALEGEGSIRGSIWTGKSEMSIGHANRDVQKVLRHRSVEVRREVWLERINLAVISTQMLSEAMTFWWWWPWAWVWTEKRSKVWILGDWEGLARGVRGKPRGVHPRSKVIWFLPWAGRGCQMLLMGQWNEDWKL